LSDHSSYAEDLELFVEAARTDSRNKLEQLHAALGDAYWVRVRDSGSVSNELRQPDDCYGPKEDLVEVFGHVAGVGVVDWEFPSLVGKEIEALLRASGVAMRGSREPNSPVRSMRSSLIRGLNSSACETKLSRT
jgi:hypothetical protein